MKITFTTVANFPENEPPKPASTFVLNWYKNLESYLSGKKVLDGNGGTSATAKLQTKFFDRYKSMFRSNKEYR